MERTSRVARGSILAPPLRQAGVPEPGIATSTTRLLFALLPGDPARVAAVVSPGQVPRSFYRSGDTPATELTLRRHSMSVRTPSLKGNASEEAIVLLTEGRDPSGQRGLIVPGWKFATDEVTEAASHPSIAAVLAARGALEEVILRQDADAWAAGLATDAVVNTPANAVARRAEVIAFFEAGLITYESMESVIEFAEARGDLVVLMGEEIVTPKDAAQNAGNTVRRRFTDVWRRDPDGRWRLTIRQATNVAVAASS